MASTKVQSPADLPKTAKNTTMPGMIGERQGDYMKSDTYERRREIEKQKKKEMRIAKKRKRKNK